MKPTRSTKIGKQKASKAKIFQGFKASRAAVPLAQSSSLLATRGPRFTQRTSRSIHLENTEFFSNWVGSVTYSCWSSALNPGNSAIFPWLRPVALQFEQYRFTRLEVIFHSQSPATLAGALALVFDLDCMDPAPGNMLEALQNNIKAVGTVWSDIVLHIPVQDKKLRYTRDGFPVDGQYDEHSYDLGTLHLISQGLAAAVAMGNVEVSYGIDLLNPQAQDTASGDVEIDLSDQSGYSHIYPFGTSSSKRSATGHTRLPGQFRPSGTGENPNAFDEFHFEEPFQGLLEIDAAPNCAKANSGITMYQGACTLIDKIEESGKSLLRYAISATAKSLLHATLQYVSTPPTYAHFVLTKVAYDQLIPLALRRSVPSLTQETPDSDDEDVGSFSPVDSASLGAAPTASSTRCDTCAGKAMVGQRVAKR